MPVTAKVLLHSVAQGRTGLCPVGTNHHPSAEGLHADGIFVHLAGRWIHRRADKPARQPEKHHQRSYSAGNGVHEPGHHHDPLRPNRLRQHHPAADPGHRGVRNWTVDPPVLDVEPAVLTFALSRGWDRPYSGSSRWKRLRSCAARSAASPLSSRDLRVVTGSWRSRRTMAEVITSI